MKTEIKKMVTWHKNETKNGRMPKTNTILLLLLNDVVVLGHYNFNFETGKGYFEYLPVRCECSNHFNAKIVEPDFWAYLPEKPN